MNQQEAYSGALIATLLMNPRLYKCVPLWGAFWQQMLEGMNKTPQILYLGMGQQALFGQLAIGLRAK